MGKQKSDRKPINARIIRVRPGGLNLKLPDGSEAWMPKLEYSYKPEERDEFVKLFKNGDEIRVVRLRKGIGGRGLIVSHKRVKNDPWMEIDDESWLGTERRIVVESMTRYRAFGSIDSSGLHGMFSFKELDKYIDKKDTEGVWKDFRNVRIGDNLIGIVEKINKNDELISLNISEYLRKIEGEPEQSLDNLEKSHTPSLDYKSIRTSTVQKASAINRLLIVDDDEAFLKAVARNLRTYEYEVTEITSYEQGKALLSEISEKSNIQNQLFDLAIIDVNLTQISGDLHGIELAKLLKEEQPSCKIILITGEPDEGSGNKIATAGDLKIEDYIYKPIDSVGLRQAIAEVSVMGEGRLLNEFFKGGKSNYKKAKIPKRDSVKNILQELQAYRPQSTAILFRVYPATLAVSIYSKVGDLPVKSRSLAMLKYSPVKDCAIDRESIFSHNAQEEDQPKHRWLLRTLCRSYRKDLFRDTFEDSYKSCIGIRIPAEEEDYVYCLFWFHREPEIFDEEPDVLRAETYAIKISSQLDYDKLMERIKRDSKFTLSGKAHSSLGHELMSALGTLDITLDNLKNEIYNDVIDQEEAAYFLGTAIVECKHALRIATTFRELAKRGDFESVGVYGCLENAIKRVQGFINKPMRGDVQKSESQKDIELLIGEKPVEKMLIQADETSLEQVFFNILLNAAQQIEAFIRDNGIVSARVEKLEEENSKYARVLISDTGPGIHRAQFERVFEPTFSTKKDGTGMGLDICRSNVEEMNGKIKVLSSTLFVGTTFEVLLPLSS